MAGHVLAAAIAFALMSAAPASADFRFSGSPCAAGELIGGFAVSGSTWLAGCAGAPTEMGVFRRTLRISRDLGGSWSNVPWEPVLPVTDTTPQASGISVGPDGAFYLGVTLRTDPAGSYGRIVRVDPGSGALTVGATVPAGSASARLSPPAWGGDGTLLVAWTNGLYGAGALTLARASGGGDAVPVATTALANALAVNVEVAVADGRTWVRAGDVIHRLDGGGLTVAPEGMPIAREGEVVITGSRISWDGGATFPTMVNLRPVEGNGALLVNRGRLLRRHGAAVWAPTALEWPEELNARTLRTADGLVVVTDQFKLRELSSVWNPRVDVGLHRGEVPGVPFSTGPLVPLFTGWLQRANELRAQTGLPPLVGDPLVARASENHSRYWTFNTLPSGANILDLHREVPGTPGYTGVTPSQRCAAVGASCGSEVMGSDPDGWVATIYHRDLLMDPTAFLVGGGKVTGGPGVMNGGERRGLHIGPVVFPNGRFDGDLEFWGEAPDPVLACRAAGQTVEWPLGTAVTVYVPAGEVSDFTVAPAGGAPLRGCTLDDAFLPDDPLQPHTTYAASATWRPTPQSAPRAIAWSFTTGAVRDRGWNDEDLKGERRAGTSRTRRCTAALVPVRTGTRRGRRGRAAAAAVRVRRGVAVAVRVTACGRGRVTLALQRSVRVKRAGARRTAIVWRAVTKRTLTMRRAGRTTATLPTRRVRPSRYRLVATLTGPSRATARTTVIVRARAASKKRRQARLNRG